MIPKYTNKILLIDDDPLFRKQVTDYLEDGGFVIVQAETGEQGLEVFHQEKPDAVVTDLQMPGMGGLGVLETLAKSSPGIPVMVVSGSREMKEVTQALRLGAWDFIPKPLPNLALLEHAVSKVLERARLVEENRIYKEKLEMTNAALKKSLDILEQDQEAGRRVQMRMLPEQNLKFGEYQFSHSVDPSLYLSGDFVDYFKISDHLVGFYIADVSGHGSSSAFVTVLLKSLMSRALMRFQNYGDDTICLPDKLLSEVSYEIYSSNLGKYLTIVYGVLDWKKNEILYCVGGHYPNPILTDRDESTFLVEKSFPAGIMKAVQYKLKHLVLQPKMQLTFFSDGIFEILPEKDLPAKEQALLSMIKSGDGTTDYFRQHLNLIEKRELPDDVTMLILKRGG